MSKAALIVNLGSPATTSTKDVRRYLDEFLMDPRVIDLPLWKRTLLVRGIILNTRPRRSAKAYRRIWTSEGSPLIVLSEKLIDAVRPQVEMPTYLAMRYAQPSIAEVIQKIRQDNQAIRELYVLPMYPQYAMSSYETVVEKVRLEAERILPGVMPLVKPPFFADADYIEVLAESYRPYLSTDFDLFLMSYHGIPERHVRKCDLQQGHCLNSGDCCQTASVSHTYCYRHQCYETTSLVTRYLDLPEEKVAVSFQSRLGNDPWLQPFTDQEFERLGNAKTDHLVVACPAFVTDCLETLEEIAMEGEESFVEAGGKNFSLVPCLNDSRPWTELVAKWLNNSREWPAISTVLRPDYAQRI